MNKLLRRWRILNTAERALRVLRVLVLLRASAPIVRTTVMFWKRKGR